jgi:hypothetical protein
VAATARLAKGRRVGALHQHLLTRLNAAGAIDWSREAVDGSHVRVSFGGF